MSNAKQLAVVPLEMPRFEVVVGGKFAAPAIVPSAVPEPALSKTSHRGLFVVDSSNASSHTTDRSMPDTFEQARRIVAQVEWEIQQQIARERRLHLLRMQPASSSASAAESAVLRERTWRRLMQLLRF